MSRIRSGALALSFVVVALVACETPEHPKNAQAADQLCGPPCERIAQCNAKTDKAKCIDTCKSTINPRVALFSDAYIADQRACSEKETCGHDVAGSISACRKLARTRFEPTALAKDYCSKAHERDVTCGFGARDTAHCLYNMKMYSEETLGRLVTCLDDPCNHYGKCIAAVVGPDNLELSDEERVELGKHGAIPTAQTSVALAGKTVVYNEATTPVAGAKICVHGDASVPCATSGADGAFSIALPTTTDVTLEVIGPKPDFAQVLVGYPAHANDTSGLTVGIPRMSLLAKRYAAAGATYPDASTGSIFATATASKVGTVDPRTVTMRLDPKGADAHYTESTKTEGLPKFHSALFTGVTPGTTKVVFEGLPCVPAYGALPTDRNDTVSVVVAPGFETEVYARCGE
ncbi:MAG TPA: hypothetical protein VF407_21570 [Polyangiaceae bacterium]